jgi:predicted nucleic acid-binding Zn ribbon protein
MDEEIKNLLKENFEVSKKSLEILRKIDRDRKIRFFFKIIFWLVIILIIYYSYQLLQPYFTFLKQSLEFLKNLQNFKPGM